MRRHGTSASILHIRHWSFFEPTFGGHNLGPYRAAVDLDSRRTGMTHVTEVLAGIDSSVGTDCASEQRATPSGAHRDG